MTSAKQIQADVVAFLSCPSAYGSDKMRVERIDTHISHVFLVTDRAYKMKRAVKFPYLDFSTPELRRRACEREVLMNRRTAPQLYEGVVPVTQASDGHFAIGGSGNAVDWLVVMRRFDGDMLLDRLADQGTLTAPLLREVTDAIVDFHMDAAPVAGPDGAAAFSALIEENNACLAACPQDAFDPGDVRRFQAACTGWLAQIAALLDRRRNAGKVRLCHGDLHLRNICLIDGHPVLFDCLEFNDALATIDILYDLSFLLMDLIHRGLKASANIVLNRYLDRLAESDGMAALPLFLALRAAIRAHIAAATPPADKDYREAKEYFSLAIDLIAPTAPSLIAIGGLSGSGKSTLAYQLAPEIGSAPGARVVRSDALRKRLAGLRPEQRLPPEAYSLDAAQDVYRAIGEEARFSLEGGRSAIIDAVFASRTERDAIEQMANACNVPFHGFWLEAALPVLERRLAARRVDASDADAQVLKRQLGYDLGKVGWTHVDTTDNRGDIPQIVSTRLALR